MFDLSGKVALITGATGGIGKSIAQRLHAAGAEVVLSGTRKNVLDDLVKEFGGRAHAMPCNLSNNQEVKELYAAVEAKIGKDIDILVCNAGITRDNLLIRMSEQEWDEVLAVNLKSVFLLNQEAVKAMGKRKCGRIINISSIVGLTGNFGQVNYSAAKAGMIGMTKSVALETAARGVTANCIAPGFIATPMTDVLNDKIKETVLAKIPMKSMGSPEDIANAALYLASDEAAYVTGQVLSVNGGMFM